MGGVGPELAVHVPAVTDPDYGDSAGGIVHLIQDAVVALTNAVPLQPGQLLAARGAGIPCQPAQSFDYPAEVGGWQGVELPGRRGPDEQIIACHYA